MSFANPGRMGLLGAPTYAMLRDSTQKALLEAMDQDGIEYSFNKSENQVTFLANRSKIIFRSLEEYERLRGTNLAWFGVDELSYAEEEAWLRLEGRLRDPKGKRHCGFGVWTPKGFDWVYKRFIVNESKGYRTIQAQPFENRHLLEAVPDFYERLRRTYTQEFFEQEVLGQYVAMGGGLVYRNFDRKVHLRKAAADGRRPILWALDFNVDPMSSVIVQTDGEDVQVLDEIVIRNALTSTACEEFVARWGAHPGGIVIYGDASGNNQHTTGSSDYGLINRFFFSRGLRVPQQRVPKSNPGVRDRISLVNSKLRNADGEVHLYVDPKCKELVQDFEELAFQAGTTVPDKKKDSARSHLSDALGYVLWQEFRKGEAGERQRRLI